MKTFACFWIFSLCLFIVYANPVRRAANKTDDKSAKPAHGTNWAKGGDGGGGGDKNWASKDKSSDSSWEDTSSWEKLDGKHGDSSDSWGDSSNGKTGNEVDRDWDSDSWGKGDSSDSSDRRGKSKGNNNNVKHGKKSSDSSDDWDDKWSSSSSGEFASKSKGGKSDSDSSDFSDFSGKAGKKGKSGNFDSESSDFDSSWEDSDKPGKGKGKGKDRSSASFESWESDSGERKAWAKHGKGGSDSDDYFGGNWSSDSDGKGFDSNENDKWDSVFGGSKPMSNMLEKRKGGAGGKLPSGVSFLGKDDN